ncbi:MAG TPA: FHA domain-containing protein [Pirellulales bacterium]|nr:FHA domain-containing protein [Pirellulales bacterium]
MRFSLRICAGKHVGREIPIRGPRFLVGCADNCHLKIRATQVGPYHCALLVQDDCLWVRDFGGGVIVGGTRIVDRRRLDPGDQLQIGPLHFEVLVQDSPVKSNDRAPDEGEILDILSEPVERPVAPVPELSDLSNARPEPPEPAETADHLAGDILHNLYHPHKGKLARFKPVVRDPAITAPSISPPEVDVVEPLPEGPLEVPQGVSVAAPKRRVIALPRWMFTSDGQLNPNLMFVLGIWAGIGLSAAVVTFWRIFGR